MEKRIIFGYNSDDNPERVSSDWDLTFRRYFNDSSFTCKLENGEMRATDPNSLEEIDIYFSPDEFLDLHELIIRGTTEQIKEREQELTRIYLHLGFKVRH